MQNLSRKQATETAQRLANETGAPHIIWMVVTRFQVDDRYRVVSAKKASESSKSLSVDCKWPREGR